MLKKIIAHISVIISLMYIVFFHIDRVNTMMAFIDHPITKTLMYVLSVTSVITAYTLLSGQKKKTRKKRRHSAKKSKP